MAHVVERMAAAGPKEILVTVPAEQEEHYAFLRKHAAVPLRVEADLRSGGGPLAGIEAGLALMRTRALVAAGCDQPFLVPALLQGLVEHAQGTDAVAFETSATLQPLPATYGKGRVPELKMLQVDAHVLPDARQRDRTGTSGRSGASTQRRMTVEDTPDKGTCLVNATNGGRACQNAP